MVIEDNEWIIYNNVKNKLGQRTAANNIQSRFSVSEGNAINLVRLEGRCLLRDYHAQVHQFGCVMWADGQIKYVLLHDHARPFTYFQIRKEVSGVWLRNVCPPTSIFAGLALSDFLFLPNACIEWNGRSLTLKRMWKLLRKVSFCRVNRKFFKQGIMLLATRLQKIQEQISNYVIDWKILSCIRNLHRIHVLKTERTFWSI